jgi:hypothetical protein
MGSSLDLYFFRRQPAIIFHWDGVGLTHISVPHEFRAHDPKAANAKAERPQAPRWYPPAPPPCPPAGTLHQFEMQTDFGRKSRDNLSKTCTTLNQMRVVSSRLPSAFWLLSLKNIGAIMAMPFSYLRRKDKRKLSEVRAADPSARQADKRARQESSENRSCKAAVL